MTIKKCNYILPWMLVAYVTLGVADSSNYVNMPNRFSTEKLGSKRFRLTTSEC